MSAATRPKAWPTNAPDLHELIRLRAEQIYYRSGGIPGRDDLNWKQAERELQAEREAHAAKHSQTTDSHQSNHDQSEDILAENPAPALYRALIVKVNGVEYVGEYSPEAAVDYSAGEFKSGEPVPVRFVGDKMFIKRPNGRELETTIVKKVG